jgi:hypothetical protein
MRNTSLETIQLETLTHVTGGGFGGWGGMIENALGGKGGREGGGGLGERMGGGGGDDRGVAGRVSGWVGGLFGGSKVGGVVEGK